MSMKKKGLFYLLDPVPLYLGAAVFLIAAVAFQIAGKGATVTAYTADALVSVISLHMMRFSARESRKIRF